MNKDIILLIKALSWRIVGTLDTFFVTWFITGQPVLALTISAVEFFTKIILYWLHERAWLPVLKRIN